MQFKCSKYKFNVTDKIWIGRVKFQCDHCILNNPSEFSLFPDRISDNLLHHCKFQTNRLTRGQSNVLISYGNFLKMTEQLKFFLKVARSYFITTFELQTFFSYKKLSRLKFVKTLPLQFSSCFSSFQFFFRSPFICNNK